MLKRGNTLHFINRLDDTNCGDMVVCPLLHYYDYFKQYHIRRHDIRFIDFDSIDASDVVIIGGGGMLDYAEFTNQAINKVLDSGAAVVAWSPGLNTHAEYDGTFHTPVDYDRFALVTVRDFENSYGLPYLPDVTCKLPGLKKEYTIHRKFGIAQHKDYPIQGFDFDVIKNDRSIDEILQFIGESEIVLSNSFHMINWAILMGKKTVCVNPFGNRFFSYRFKPAYYYSQKDDFDKCVANAQIYHILEQNIAANDAFFALVRNIVEQRLSPVTGNLDLYENVTLTALYAEKLRERQLTAGDLIASALYADLGSGFSEDRKRISIENVYGNEVHTVRFDLSGMLYTRTLRFHPISGFYCETEILSAKDAKGSVQLDAQASVRQGNWDRFLTTDPQYIIAKPCHEFLEIQFKLQGINHSEAEHLIYGYVDQTKEQFTHLDDQISNQNRLLGQQRERLEWQEGQIGRQEALLDNLNDTIAEQNALLVQQRERLEWQESQIGRQEALLDNLNNTNAEHNAQMEGLRAELDRMKNSFCWKMEAALQSILDSLKHERK